MVELKELYLDEVTLDSFCCDLMKQTNSKSNNKAIKKKNTQGLCGNPNREKSRVEEERDSLILKKGVQSVLREYKTHNSM